MKQLYALLLTFCAVLGSRNAMGQNPTYDPYSRANNTPLYFMCVR